MNDSELTKKVIINDLTIYPISSAMILVCSEKFSNINIYHLILINIPAFIASIAIGVFYIRKFLKNTKIKKEDNQKNYKGLIYLLPPVIPLICYVILQLFSFPQIRSFLIGVVFSIIVLFFLIEINLSDYIQLIKKSLTIKLALAIFGIMIFREMFNVSQANILIADMIGSIPIPSLLIVIIVPLLLGILTGYNLGAIALSYFLVEPFFSFTGINIIGLTSLIFTSSLAGYLISPIHLCNVLSSEYLKTDTTRMYKMYIPAVIMLLFIQTIFVIFVSFI